ncbi:MAG: tRNA (adenosine(37)-N6)-threonylcarbamoyltransferase complex ATPase subunit type 1 TsaE [bacterium]
MEIEQFLKNSGISINEILNSESSSTEETLKTARSFSETLEPGVFVLLTGELGSGKTTFVRGIAERLECAGEVHSPSYKIINRYAGKSIIFHIDFYRLKKYEEVIGTGIEDIFRENAVFAIEWPEIFIGYFRKFFLVDMEYNGEGKRRIKIFDCRRKKGQNE